MSFQARLFLEDNEYPVLNAEYALSMPMDQHNRPNGRLRGGIIELTIESGSVNFGEILSWVVNTMPQNGRIEFSRRDTGSSTQKIVRFSHGYCISMKDIFVSNGTSPMITKITISAHTIEIDNEVFHNTWAGIESETSDSESAGSTTPVETQTENSISFE